VYFDGWLSEKLRWEAYFSTRRAGAGLKEKERLISERGGAPILAAAGWKKISASHVRLAPVNASIAVVAMIAGRTT
jgi:hypothetical protein